MKKEINIIIRLINKIYVNDYGCWIWTAYYKERFGFSYGWMRYNGKSENAHRVSYKVFKGEILDGFEIDHLCRNTLCINPDHLEVVVHAENMKRGNLKNNGEHERSKTHCIRGHEYNKDNTYRNPNENKRKCRECMRIIDKNRRQRIKSAMEVYHR